MDKRALWSKILLIIGLVLMVAGIINPLKASAFNILPGIGLAAYSAYLIKSRYRKLLYLAFCLAAVGLGIIIFTGIYLFPYFAGWVMGLVGAILMLKDLRKRPASHK
jgi:uncharacterized membrane protein YczE